MFEEENTITRNYQISQVNERLHRNGKLLQILSIVGAFTVGAKIPELSDWVQGIENKEYSRQVYILQQNQECTYELLGQYEK